MRRRPPRSTRTDTLFPYTTLFRSSFYIWQQVQRWPTNGEEDYPRNLRALSAYLTPSCRAFLQQDYEYRRASGELRQRVRGIYEIPGRGYGAAPARSDERRVGKECVSTCRHGRSADHEKQKQD